MKPDIHNLIDSATLHQARRLIADEPNRLAAYALEVDIIEQLKRIYYFSKHLARAIMPDSTQEET